MRPTHILPLLLAAALPSWVPAHAASSGHRPARQHSAPAGSFTSLRVESYAELKSMVRRDPVVRRRYAAFFHMPESAVSQFVATELYPVRLTRARTCVVYFVTPKGKFYSHTIRLNPGSRVFALRSGGQPALNYVCGNGFLIPIKNKAYTVTDSDLSPFQFGLDTPTDSLIQLASVGPVYTATPVSTLVSPFPPVTPPGVSRFLPLAALGLLGIPTGHSHTPPVVVPAVPEPGAAILLLAGAPLLALVARRRSRRTHGAED